jgi:hypothetical protein
MDHFLRRHDVNVARSLAVLMLASAVGETISMILQPFLLGRMTLNFGAPLMLWVGCALWQYRPWARTLLLVLGWLTVSVVAVLAARALLFGGGITLTLGGQRLEHPTKVQYAIFMTVTAALAYPIMRILHSAKFREEMTALRLNVALNSPESA